MLSHCSAQLHTVRDQLIMVEDDSISSVTISAKSDNLFSAFRNLAPPAHAHLNTTEWKVDASKVCCVAVLYSGYFTDR